MKYILITSLFAALHFTPIHAQNLSQNTLNLSDLSAENSDDQKVNFKAGGLSAPVQDYGKRNRVSLFYSAGISLSQLKFPENKYQTIQSIKHKPSLHFGVGCRFKLTQKAFLEFDFGAFRTRSTLEGIHYADNFYYHTVSPDTLAIIDEKIDINLLNFQGGLKLRYQPISSLPVFFNTGLGFQRLVNNRSERILTRKTIGEIVRENGLIIYKRLNAPIITQETYGYYRNPYNVCFIFSVEIMPFPYWNNNVSVDFGLSYGLAEIGQYDIRQHFLNLGLKCKM